MATDTPIRDTDTSRAIREELAQRIIDGPLPHAAETLLTTLITSTREELDGSWFQGATDMLYLGAATAEHPDLRDTVEILNGLIQALENAEYAEYGEEGEGVTYRTVANLLERVQDLSCEIRVWAETLARTVDSGRLK